MYTFMRLTRAYNLSDEITFDENSKIVFFSDCHRGDKSKADNFYPNCNIYLTALDFYYSNGYIYIELGDGDELWENDKFPTLFNAHDTAYLLLQKFYLDKKLYMLWGNHDVFKSHETYVKNNFYRYYDSSTKSYKPLFENIKIHEGLILKYNYTPYKIFVFHGHQGHIFDDILWPFSRFIVRNFGKPLELLHSRSRIYQIRNEKKLQTTERNIKLWSKYKHHLVITGHTHKPAFPKPGQIPYFNDGCCVENGYITCIEIQNGEISLVRWKRSNDSIDNLSVTREVFGGPNEITAYFQK